MFSKVGPYVYKEYDDYQDVTYSGDTVSSTLNQGTTHVSDPGDIDTPMWLPNQGAIKKWWSMQNAWWWTTYMKVMYNMVNYWQGEYL